MEPFDNLDSYELNLQKIVAQREMLSVTRLLAATLLNTPYMTVGEFVSSLSDSDLEQLMDVADGLEREEEGDQDFNKVAHLEELILITEMLVRAEGLITTDANALTHRVNAFSTFLACEGLSRKGIVKLHHQNMSFGEDMGEKILLEKIEGIDLDDYM